MTIRVVCPNGHALSVKDRLGGKVGRCPKCKAEIRIPMPRDDLTEDAIMDILGAHESVSAPHAARPGTPATAEVPATRAEQSVPPKKSCHKCHQEIESGTHICPHCNTYIAGLTDF